MSKFKNIFEQLNIDDYLTKPPKVDKKIQNRIKNNTFLFPHMNYMMDLLFLPTTKEGYKYLLCIVDLADDQCDFEPVGNKKPETILQGMKNIFKRSYIEKPKFSIRTDDGAEFKSVVDDWFYNNSILHRTSPPYSHKIPNVENLNKQIGMILNLYMNSIENATGETYREWTDIIPTIRVELNKMRRITPEKLKEMRQLQIKNTPDFDMLKPNFKVGDIVMHKLYHPLNALGEKQATTNFRQGDIRWSKPVKIVKIIEMSDKPYIRYKVEGIQNASFSENELKIMNPNPKKLAIKKILEKKGENPVKYLVWFEHQKKLNAVWMTEKQLIDKGYKTQIDDFNKP